MSDEDVCYEQEEPIPVAPEPSDPVPDVSDPALSMDPAARFEAVKTLIADPRVGYHCARPSVQPLSYGWFFDANQVLLDCLIARAEAGAAQPLIVLELGSFYGKSTSYLLSRCQGAGALVFAADMWDAALLRSDPHYKPADAHVMAAHPLFETFLANTWKHRLRLRDGQFSGLVPMRVQTVEAVRLLHAAGLRPDVVYVDGCHHFAAVLADLQQCALLLPGSALCGEGFDHADVRRAVEQVAGELGVSVTVEGGRCWAMGTLRAEELDAARRNISDARAGGDAKRARLV